MRMVIYVSRAFCSKDQEKRETARSLDRNIPTKKRDSYLLLQASHSRNCAVLSLMNLASSSSDSPGTFPGINSLKNLLRAMQ